MRMKILNRVFKCYYMSITFIINFVYKRSKCCRFTWTCWTRYQNQSSFLGIQVNNRPWNAKAFRLRNLCSYNTHGTCHRPSLSEYINSVSSNIRNREWKIKFSSVFKHCLLPVIHNIKNKLFTVIWWKLRIIKIHKFTINSDSWWKSYSDMHITCLLFFSYRK